jgi:hypothetical protein
VPNSSVFCNTPWYELHIYWDGSFGICCQERHKLYAPGETQYNIAHMSMQEWFDSEPVRNFRMAMFADHMHTACGRCARDEHNGNDSRRFKSNQKSVIFTKTAFEPSWQQSPGRRHFQHSLDNQGQTTSHPIDLHIDLGNYCNLACKMCSADASTTIASQEVRWGKNTSKKFLAQDWTRDQTVWDSFKQQLLAIPGLNQIHFMGGETLLTPRLEDLVDFMIKHERFDLCFSFVTNGTQYNHLLMQKLSRFKRVGIEISIETLNPVNDYIRQGSKIQAVLENVQRFRSWSNDSSITVAIRPAPSVLSIGTYVDLLQWALEQQLVVKSNIVISPKFMDITILPHNVKLKYLPEFEQLLRDLDGVDTDSDFNASNPNNVKHIIKTQVQQCISALTAPQPEDADELLEQLVKHCQQWDQIYKLDARVMYPELAEVWDKYGY